MKWNLYRIQDADRPAFVVATSYQDAINRWKQALRNEEPDIDDDVEIEDPSGVEYLTDYADLILPE